MPQLQKTAIAPDVTLIEVIGQITLGRECQQVEWLVEELIRAGQAKIVFDLSKLDYLDSTGIGIVVTCSGKADAAGGQLRLACLQPKVADLMRVTKLNRIMTFYPTVNDALQGLGTPSET